MTERLADIVARIDGIAQLGTVVNAMRGIAAARARQARSQLGAVDSYAATIATAIGRALSFLAAPAPGNAAAPDRTALVVFSAEQGFVGSFNERVLDAIAADLVRGPLFIVGTRGTALLSERQILAAWQSAMPAHTVGIPRLADRIAEAVYARVAAGEIDRLDAVFSQWQPGQSITIRRRRLFPLDLTQFPAAREANPPLLTLRPEQLLRELTEDYLHAQLCNIALHAFAAENEARMEAMAKASTQIDRQLATLRGTQRQVRQAEITAEIVELVAGETAGLGKRPRGSCNRAIVQSCNRAIVQGMNVSNPPGHLPISNGVWS